MKAFLLALVVAVAFAHDHAGHSHDHGHEAGGKQDHVLDLTSANFDSTVAKNDILLVEFFAPWCGHCKRLAPEYEKAGAELWGQVSLAKVDCTEEKALCEKYEVQGFPTLKLFKKDGSNTEYDKGRTAGDIVKFLKKQSQPAVTNVGSADDLTKFKASDNVAVVAFLDDQSSATAVAFKAAADALRNDYSFGIAKASLGGSHSGKIVLFRNFDTPEVVFSGENTAEALSQFISAESFPLMGEIGPENYQKYVERGVPLFWFFLDFESEGEKQIEKDAVEIASTVKGKLSFVKLDGKRWASHAKNFGLSGTTPGLAIEVRDGNKKYVFPESEKVTKAALTSFVEKWVAGTLAPTVRSAEIPTENSGPVTVIVGKTYEQIVNDKSKDVMVEFYAPWCGHCKNLAPKYDALGEEFKGTDVVIAKIDATENDHPREDVKGFPTLVFFPANDKTGLVYSGERSTEALAGFIRMNGATIKGGASSGSKKADAKPAHDEL